MKYSATPAKTDTARAVNTSTAFHLLLFEGSPSDTIIITYRQNTPQPPLPVDFNSILYRFFFIRKSDKLELERGKVMNYQIGTQIRSFRHKCSLTQEQLAQHLNVTSQTVSKWENNISYPDIVLLPELTALLGMTMDELFQISSETHLKRIEQMLEHDLSQAESDYVLRELEEAVKLPEHQSEALTLLAQYYLNQSEALRKLAKETALKAIETDPFKKENHSIFNIASNAHVWDWCAVHHSDYIDTYQRLIKKYPEYPMGYEWLISNLIADNRLAEAEEVLHQMKPFQDKLHFLLYQGWILWKQGNHHEANACWNKMTETDDWLGYSFKGDVHASLAQYNQAIECFMKSSELEPSPRYIDNWLSIAQIYQILKMNNDAILAYKKSLEILKEDHQLTEGILIDEINGYIANLSKE